MKKILSVATVCAVCVAMSGYVMAGDKAEGAATKAPAAALEDVTVVGKLSKVEAPAKGGAAGAAGYVLTDAAGNKIRLPKVAAAEGEAAINLEELVGADVEVVGKGKVKENNGKKMTMLKSITSVKKVEAKADAPVVEKKAE